LKEITVGNENGNIKLVAFLRHNFPHMPVSAIYKAIRKKDVKINGRRAKEDYTVLPGDLVQVYIPDNILYGIPRDYLIPGNSFPGKGSAGPGLAFPPSRGFSIVYEDSNIMIINKEQGIPVHPDRQQKALTVIDSVKNYLEQKGRYDGSGSSFAPSLCHRLDRNTGGLVIIAKNYPSLKTILNKLKAKEIKRYYQCLVAGKMEEDEKELRAFLEKVSNQSRVFIHGEKNLVLLKLLQNTGCFRTRMISANLKLNLLQGAPIR